jgi:hypothetical protein
VPHLHPRVRHFAADLGLGLLSLLRVAGRTDDVGAGARELTRRDQPEAAVGAGDERGATGLIRDRLVAPLGDRMTLHGTSEAFPA